MTTDLELQLKAKYDELASGAISYSDFTTWFEQQQWPSGEETDRMFEAVELTGAHIKNAGSTARRSEPRPSSPRSGTICTVGPTSSRPRWATEGMSQDALRHAYEDKHEEGTY